MRILIALLLATPAFAQEPFDAAPHVEICTSVADADEMRGCIGAASAQCMEETDGGQTTIGMAMCLQAETQAWDAALNAEYGATMAWAKALDEDEAEYFPEFANRAEALRDAQRAWISFRDGECGFAYAQWGSGSMRHIAGNSCLLQMTAERAIRLFEMRQGPQ